MIPEEITKKVHLIEIASLRAIDQLLAGKYRSVFKGRGAEFNEVREYAPGDEFRAIDWNVTARRGNLYVKHFSEERQQTLMFLADLSASTAFGSAGKSKAEIIAEVVALLALSAVRNDDCAGLLIFSDEVELYIPPSKGQTHVRYLITEILRFNPRRKGTNIRKALEYYLSMINRKCVTFLLSDFQDANFEKPLGILSRRSDVVAVSVTDLLERALPAAGLIELRDNETGETFLADAADAGFRQAYQAVAQERSATLAELFSRCEVDQIEVQSDRDHVGEIVEFFRCRAERTSLGLLR